MPSVCKHYKIDEPVPFVDVDVDVDTRLFVDPRVIRLQHSPQPFVNLANRCTETFFAEITRCAMSQEPADRHRGIDLLQQFGEPRETRLGMTVNGAAGHGGADDIGESIWRELTSEVGLLLRVGKLQEIELLPLFVPGVGNDITSDLTTRIVFEPLAMFTTAVVEQFAEFRSRGQTVKAFERPVWEPDRLEWTRKTLVLPVANGRPLVLVPQSWVSRSLLMTPGRYYETSVLSYAQDELAVSVGGKVLKSPKWALKRLPSLTRSRATNRDVTLRAHANDTDLIGIFTEFVDSRYINPQTAAA